MLKRTAFWLTIAALAWGALAFGAVYEWAYPPLMVAVATAGLLGMASRRAVAPWLAIAVVVVAAAIGLQLVPLAESTLTALSPETPAALSQLDPAFASGANRSHAISINSTATWKALVIFSALALFALGLSSLLELTGTVRLVQCIAVLGVLVAMVGIIQAPLYKGRMYGFWTPELGWHPFGPFVNKNHFAGWMLMALAVTLGLFCERAAKGMRGVRPSLRNRLVWLSSPDAGKLMLIGLAVLVMATSIVLTLSRSGIVALLLVIAMTGWFAARASIRKPAKIATLVFLIFVVAAVFAWVGPATLAGRFGEGGSRSGPWNDAIDVARRFPAAGTGINTYSDAMLLYQTYQTDIYHYSAAHNDYLQVLAEGGILVGLPVLAAIAILTVTIYRRMREDRGHPYHWLRAGAVTALVAIAAQELVDFSLQIPGIAVLFAAIVAIAVHRRPASARP